jgi:hypothetical protein
MISSISSYVPSDLGWTVIGGIPQENRPGLFDETGTREVLVAWYGPEAASEIIAARTRNWRITKWIFLAWVGILVLVSILSWFRG